MVEWGWLRADRSRIATVVLALLAAAVALLVSRGVFPHHSLNHDEGVYLQQADLLLRGRLFLRPPVADAFRPWFFVEGSSGLYAKYAPLPASVFALGKAAGGYPLALAGVAAAVVGLTSAVGRELYDARTGLLAGLLLFASPLFLVQSGVFLPYATTTALNLAFALAYLRAERLASLRWALLAGAAVGLAFFARPFTAVLFAAPFVGHACWTLLDSVRDGPPDRSLLARRVATAAIGTGGVLVALGYNWVVTGDPLLFPYQAFAPLDGVGFGHRELLGYGVDYTLALAARANAAVLWNLFTQWVVAGPLGTLLAAVGLWTLVRHRGPETSRRALLAALLVTVPLGNLAFWGNLNILGVLSAPGDGLVHYLGPYYHYDLLVPVAVFGAHGALVLRTRLREAVTGTLPPARARRVALAVLVVSAVVLGGVAAATAAAPLTRNRAVSDELAAGYAPFSDGGPADAVVYLPTPYGPWLNHPFQDLRNAGYDGRTVYALRDVRELAVAGAYPDRDLYRYVSAGPWDPTDGERVTADIRRVHRVAGESVALRARLGMPPDAEAVTVRVSTDEGAAYYVADTTGETLDLTVTVVGERVRVSGANLSQSGDATLRVAERDEVTVVAHVRTGSTAGVTYRLVFPVARENGTVRALSPTREYCPVPTRCAAAGVGETPPGVSLAASFGNETAR